MYTEMARHITRYSLYFKTPDYHWLNAPYSGPPEALMVERDILRD